MLGEIGPRLEKPGRGENSLPGSHMMTFFRSIISCETIEVSILDDRAVKIEFGDVFCLQGPKSIPPQFVLTASPEEGLGPGFGGIEYAAGEDASLMKRMRCFSLSSGSDGHRHTHIHTPIVWRIIDRFAILLIILSQNRSN